MRLSGYHSSSCDPAGHGKHVLQGGQSVGIIGFSEFDFTCSVTPRCPASSSAPTHPFYTAAQETSWLGLCFLMCH